MYLSLDQKMSRKFGWAFASAYISARELKRFPDKPSEDMGEKALPTLGEGSAILLLCGLTRVGASGTTDVRDQ